MSSAEPAPQFDSIHHHTYVTAQFSAFFIKILGMIKSYVRPYAPTEIKHSYAELREIKTDFVNRNNIQ